MTLASDVAKLVGISPASSRRIATSAHRRYKVFFIPKRGSTELRKVAQPAREVKAIQRAIVAVLSPLLPVHEAATAYKPASSILENARRHADAKFLTKLDFNSFFPSIDASAVSRLLCASIPDILESDISFILNACLWRGDGRHALCVGAPSSPLLSNAVMYDFDVEASRMAAACGGVYTRYSDDISISAVHPDVLSALETQIRDTCAQMRRPSLTFNAEKRVAVGRSTAMRVTGLTLANDGSVTVGRVRKRGVRAGLQRFLVRGISLEDAAQLKGEIAFVLSVEPQFREVLMATYGARIVDFLPRLSDRASP